MWSLSRVELYIIIVYSKICQTHNHVPLLLCEACNEVYICSNTLFLLLPASDSLSGHPRVVNYVCDRFYSLLHGQPHSVFEGGECWTPCCRHNSTFGDQCQQYHSYFYACIFSLDIFCTIIWRIRGKKKHPENGLSCQRHVSQAVTHPNTERDWHCLT